MRIYLYGNCQMTALGWMILEQHPDWHVDSFDVSTLTEDRQDEQLARHFQAVRGADVVVAHPIGDYRGEVALSLETLRDELTAPAKLMTFPSIVFEGTHGAFTYIGERLQGYHMPYHNSHVLEMSLRGYHWDDVCTLLRAPDYYTSDFVSAGIEASLAQLRSRERINRTTIQVSPILDEACRSTVMMNTINHPKRVVLTRVLNEVYGLLGVPRTAKEQGEDYLRFPFIPPLPSLLHHIGAHDDAPEFQVPGRTWTREEYWRGSLGYYARLRRTDLVRCFAGSRGQEFLASFRAIPVGAGTVTEDMLPSTVDAFVQSLVTETFEVMLQREPDQAELSAHGTALRGAGIRPWLTLMLQSPEFKRRFGIDESGPTPH